MDQLNPSVFRPALSPAGDPDHSQQSPKLLSLHRLRIDLIIFLVRTKESNHQNAALVRNQRHQSIVVALNVKDYSTALENARLRMRLLHILRRSPIGLLRNRAPGIKLRPRGFEALASLPGGKIRLHQLGTNDYHWTGIFLKNSIKWNA